MRHNQPEHRMILCGGLQSGGTTLISWCFLQRQDTDGVLDMANDVLRVEFSQATAPVLWIKMTVGAFRWLDVAEVYRDLGWRVEPLLIVRDARAAYESLMRKDYGVNGTTAEQPPLRLRFRRFLHDWDLFRANGWPIVKYEDFVADERAVLCQICERLGLPWDEGMLTWPKKTLAQIAYSGPEANETFAKSLAKGSLAAAKLSAKAEVKLQHLPATELQWLEETFATYHAFHGYPASIAPPPTAKPALAPPSFEDTGRHWFLSEIERLQRELDGCLNGVGSATASDVKKMAVVEGHLDEVEAQLLFELAADIAQGCIVEIGSYRGRSTVALALGSQRGNHAPVYAIEPHGDFIGSLNARFGPWDRVEFFRNLLRADCVQTVRLVNLRAEAAVRAWDQPIGLLWIDGDHAYEAVKRDFECWQPFVLSEGLVAFHDSVDETLGPARVVRQALASGRYEKIRHLGLTTVLRKKREGK